MSAAAVAIEGLSVRLGAFALRGIDLAVAAGEILVLLGPNGAGKSVTVETIAGFHRPHAGRIAIGGRDVTALPPEQRRVGLVFQNFSLFPHLSVRRNVAIGVGRGAPGKPARGRLPQGDVPALLDYFAIGHLAERKPHELSAGECQRASLARAFATRPDLLLFDEPFSALDARTRERLRADLGHFLRAAGIPAIFVTHDHADALALADRVAVIHRGAILQHGTPADIFERPRNGFIAEFVGIENLLVGRVIERAAGGVTVAIGDRMLRAAGASSAEPGQRVLACIRAENVTLRPAAASATDDDGANRLIGRVVAVAPLGPVAKVTLDCGFALAAYAMRREAQSAAFAPGATLEAALDPRAVHLAGEA